MYTTYNNVSNNTPFFTHISVYVVWRVHFWTHNLKFKQSNYMDVFFDFVSKFCFMNIPLNKLANLILIMTHLETTLYFRENSLLRGSHQDQKKKKYNPHQWRLSTRALTSQLSYSLRYCCNPYLHTCKHHWTTRKHTTSI